MDRDITDLISGAGEALTKIFGYHSFRPGQQELVEGLLKGRDVLGVMPTGSGKSLCYQIPAMVLNGTTLVISPLISLMKDQVTALRLRGIPVAFLNSVAKCWGEGNPRRTAMLATVRLPSASSRLAFSMRQ